MRLMQKLALGFAATFALGCNFIFDFSATQCSADADCVGIGLSGAKCQERVCVMPGAGGQGGQGGGGGQNTGCVDNQQCIDENQQLPYICRRSDGECISLISEDCTQVLGYPKQDPEANNNAVFFGFMGSFTGPLDFVGDTYRVVADLVIEEFDTFLLGGGLPGGADGARRPVVLVQCDAEADPVRAATYLAEEIQVPAIEGPGFSADVLAMAQIAIDNEVLILSNAASSPQLADLQDDGLIWSTAPNTLGLAPAMGGLLTQVEAEVRTNLALMPSDKIKVVLAIAGDELNAAFLNPLIQDLNFNGESVAENLANGNWLTRTYADPTEETVDWTSLTQEIIAFEPHVIILQGLAESYTQIGVRIEDGWPGALGYDPIYLSMHFDPGLASTVLPAHPTSRPRWRGVTAFTDTSAPGYQTFSIKYQEREPDGKIPGLFHAGIYDALYSLAYATVAAGNATTLNGKALAAGLGRILPPGQVKNVLPDELSSGLNLLVTDPSAVDLVGIQSDLNWDILTGHPPLIASIWCIDDLGQQQDTTQRFDQETGELTGTYTCP